MVEKSSVATVMKKLVEIEDLFPYERKLLKEHLLHTLCPSWGKEYVEVEAFLRSVEASERAKRFLEALEKGEDDRN